MRAIRFLETRRLADGRTFEQGSVHLLSDASAMHFVKRDQAEFYTEVKSDPPAEIEQRSDPPQDDEQVTQDSTDGDSMEGSVESVEEPDSSDPVERPEPFIAPASHPATTRGRTRGRCQ